MEQTSHKVAAPAKIGVLQRLGACLRRAPEKYHGCCRRKIPHKESDDPLRLFVRKESTDFFRIDRRREFLLE